MRIAVAGGKTKADFLIRSLLGKKHRLVVINDDPAYCGYLSRTHGIPVVQGDACKRYVLDDAEIDGFDILIALRPLDADNLVICQTAKRLYHVRKTVAVVANPKNVAVFQKLGVNTAISATWMVAEMIEQASTVESLVSSLSVEHGRLVLTELLVEPGAPAAGRRIMELPLGENIVISCILRGVDMLAPQGKTVIQPRDKLLALCAPERQEHVIRVVTGEGKGHEK